MSLIVRLMQGLLTLSLLGIILQYLILGTPDIIETPPLAGPVVADTYLVEASNWQYDDEGYKSTELTVTVMEHYSEADISLISNPRLAIFETGKAVWSVTAQNGAIEGGADRIRLSGSVALVSLLGGTRLDTTAMDIYPKSKLARSDSTVELRDGNSFLTADTMEANLERDQVTLRQNVRGSHVATP